MFYFVDTLVAEISVNHYHHHLSLNREGRWGTTDDFATSFLHFSLSSTALLDLANSRPVHSLMLSSHLFLCLLCLLLPLPVPCKMVFARPDERETWPYRCNLRLFTVVRSSCGQVARWIYARTSLLVTWMRCVASCGSTSFLWLVFFFGALLWGFMIHKHTGRQMWQGSASIVSWNWKKYSCHFRLVSTLSMLLLQSISLS